MNYIQGVANSIYYAFDEVKNLIVLLDKVYNPSHYEDVDNEDNDDDVSGQTIHSHYTIANLFDIMCVYNDIEIQKVNIEIIDYLYHIVNKFFLFCINFFFNKDVNPDNDNENDVSEIKRLYDDKYNII